MNNATEVTLDAQTVSVIAEFERLKAEIRKLETARAAAQDAITEALRGHDRGLDAQGQLVVKVSHRARTNVDRKLLENAFPEAFAATNSITTYDVLMTSYAGA